MKKQSVLEKDSALFNIIFSSIVDDIACLVMIDNDKDVYRVLEWEENFQGYMKAEGTLKELYMTLFHHSNDWESAENSDYLMFADEEIFKKEKYRGMIRLTTKGVDMNYFFRIIKHNEKESILMFLEESSVIQSNRLELEKIDTIQESYLFSMIVDLTKDSCMNPNTTELNANRQDYMDIKYSDWRLMISNMFKEEDKALFLRVSSPEYVINTLEMQKEFHIDIQMMNMQGQFVWCRLNFARMKYFSRSNPRFVYTVRDISEDIAQLLRQEGIIKAIEEQNEKLQRADLNRTKFFSNMSHEIRTPINAIMGMNEVILRDCRDETIKSYAEDVKMAGQYLLSLVNDILDYSKIEAGKMEIVPVEYNIKDLIDSTCKLVKTKLEMKSLDFELHIEEDVPSRLFGDEIRISQILVNLLSNAIKYTDQGTISLFVDRQDDMNGQAAIRFIVKDTGIGIKKEDMELLFEEYGRLELLKNRNQEGTGLGISIVQGLLTQMNSKLHVESTYGEGSEFSFVLPQKIVLEEAISPEEAAGVISDEENNDVSIDSLDMSDKKVLVVDDTPLNLKIFCALMAPFDIEVFLAESGKDALAIMKENRFDLIFMDHLMPEMDGVETLHALRELNDYYKQVPVISLTSNYSATAREEYISLGFTDYLEKPIVPECLEEVIRKFL
ncbi:MAG: ATP-binding protein [Lachnospiraceae bacterium]